MINNLMHIELKTGYSDDGSAWIGYVKTSKSKKILTFPQMRANMIIEKECYSLHHPIVLPVAHR